MSDCERVSERVGEFWRFSLTLTHSLTPSTRPFLCRSALTHSLTHSLRSFVWLRSFVRSSSVRSSFVCSFVRSSFVCSFVCFVRSLARSSVWGWFATVLCVVAQSPFPTDNKSTLLCPCRILLIDVRRLLRARDNTSDRPATTQPQQNDMVPIYTMLCGARSH